MKILFVNHSSFLTGATISCFNLLAKLGDNFSPVFATKEDGPILNDLKKMNINTYIIERKGFLGILYIKSFLRILKNEKIDVLHLNTLTPFCKYAGIAGFLKKVPIVWVVRENPLISRSRRLRFWLKNLSSKIVFVDNDTKEKLLAGDYSHVEVIYNGVDLDFLRPVKSKFLFEKFNIDENNKLIGYIGLITKRKGIEYLVKALPLVKDLNYDFKLIIIGGYKPNDKEYFIEIKRLIKELSLEKEVYFTGLLQDIRDALNNLDIVVLPSLEERCSRTLLESLACAKAVISTNVGGNPEIIEDGVNGILVEPKNERQLAEAIVRLLKNDELRQEMGRRGRLRAEKMFDIKNHIQKMRRIYWEVSSIK